MPETLHRIDFSQDTLPTEVDLGNITPEQRETINRVSANRDATVYFTAAELSTFRDFIQNWTAWEDFEAFLTAQLDEWLASSDIASQWSEYSERLEQLDAYAKQILFGSNWVLQWVEDPVAQDHMAVWFAMSLLAQIAPDRDISAEDFEWIINGDNDTFTTDVIEKLRILSDIPNTVFQSGWSENSVCMDVNQSLAFFNELFSDEFSDIWAVEARLEWANTSDEIELSFEGLDIAILTQIQTIADRLAADWALPDWGLPATSNNTNNGSPESEEEWNWLERMFEILSQWLRSLADAFWGDDNDENSSNNVVPANRNESIEVSPEQVTQAFDFFENNSQTMFDGIPIGDFSALFADQDAMWDFEKSIIENVAAFHGSNTVTQWLEFIFVETLPSKTDNTIEVSRLERFMQERNAIIHDSFNIRNTDGSINIVNLQMLVRRYQDYSVWDFNGEHTSDDEETSSFSNYWETQQ